MKLIVADSSPLIMLAASELLQAVSATVGEIIVPKTVFAECTARPDKRGALQILSARQAEIVVVHDDIPDDGSGRALFELDAGERAAILLARSLHCSLLIDERLGRDAARRLGVTIVGSAGLLIEMKTRGAILAVRPVLDQWRSWGYFLSADLVRLVLEKAGEG